MIINIFKDIKSFLLGVKQYTFYFQTLTFGDSMLSLWFFFLQLIGFNKSSNSRELFLDEVYKLFNFNKAYLFGSARSGLYSILKSLNHSNGSEVLVTGFTCEVVPNAIINAGYLPIYVDINPTTYCMDPKNVEKLITKKTKVIIIQHTFGIPAKINELVSIAKKYDLFVIEDCAVSLGSRYNGKLTGTFGDASIFSFELSKTITSCWGGMLLLNTNDTDTLKSMDDFYDKVPEQTNFKSLKILFQLGISGILYRPHIHVIGKYLIAIFYKLKIFSVSTSALEKKAKLNSKYLVKLSTSQAKVVLRQFKRLDSSIKSKIKIKEQFIHEFSNHLDSDFVKNIISNDVILIRFPLLTRNRKILKDLFDSNKIELGFWFTAPLSSDLINHKLFNYTFNDCICSEMVADQIINIPIIKINPSFLKIINKTI